RVLRARHGLRLDRVARIEHLTLVASRAAASLGTPAAPLLPSGNTFWASLVLHALRTRRNAAQRSPIPGSANIAYPLPASRRGTAIMNERRAILAGGAVVLAALAFPRRSSAQADPRVAELVKTG